MSKQTNIHIFVVHLIHELQEKLCSIVIILYMKALDVNRCDAWASHCVAHINEMTGRYKEGIQFMTDSENNWNVSRHLFHHINNLVLKCNATYTDTFMLH